MEHENIVMAEEPRDVLRRKVVALRTEKPVKLLPERDLSRLLGISRVALRNGLAELKREGLIIQEQGRGTFITPKDSVKEVHLFMAPDLKPDDPFFVLFISQLSKNFARHSISVRFVTSEKTSLDCSAIPLILVGVVGDNVLERLSTNYRHLLAVHLYPLHDFITQVQIDNYEVGYLAARELLKAGCKTLIHVGGPEHLRPARLRRAGFLDGVGSGYECLVISGKMNWASGCQSAQEVIEFSRRFEQKAGVFAANDLTALGLLQKLGEAHVRVPEEISVIGCDNLPLAAETTPGLSTFNWDIGLIANELIRQIHEMTFDPSYCPRRILYPAHFIKRGTS